MHRNSGRAAVPLLFAGIVLLNPCAVEAQKTSYLLQLEVLTQPLPSYQLHARTWGEVFFRIGRRAVFRSGRPGEKVRVEVPEGERQKSVLVVGMMNRDGSITFDNRRYVVTDPEPLNEWLDKLEEYGAKGPPDEDATWGLNDDQYTKVLELLIQPVTMPLQCHSAVAVMDSLQLPTAFQVRFTEAAKVRAVGDGRVSEPDDGYIGLSKGSALAAALATMGLGFRPKVGDDGQLVIEVDAGNEADNLYPVGWKNTTPITLVVPELAKSIDVDLEDAPLDALIQLIAQKLKRPVLYSSFALKAAGKDVAKIKYSRKPDRLTLFSLIDILGKTHDIGLSLRTDEAGSVFLWVTTEDDYVAFRKRFAHVKLTP